MNDEQPQRVGFFRGLWAVGRGLLTAAGKLLGGGRRLFAFGASRIRDTSDDADDKS